MARMKIFMDNLRNIAEHNERFKSGAVPYEMGLNEFSDMSHDEFHFTMHGHRSENNNSSGIQGIHTHVVSGNAEIPKSIDWRTKGAVTSVDNQGSCTVCWAISSCGALEAAHFRKRGQLKKLSTQNLVDCVDRNKMGCYFGNFYSAYQYIKSNGGIDTDQSYPFQENKEQCRYDERNEGATVETVASIPKGDENALTHAIATVGPVIVSINGDLLQHYKSGVFQNSNCNKMNLNHEVLAVGYGTGYDGDYHIVKNSWGEYFKHIFNFFHCTNVHIR